VTLLFTLVAIAFVAMSASRLHRSQRPTRLHPIQQPPSAVRQSLILKAEKPYDLFVNRHFVDRGISLRSIERGYHAMAEVSQALDDADVSLIDRTASA
jgi:hypothetical protein